jgi:hypothetical protein
MEDKYIKNNKISFKRFLALYAFYARMNTALMVEQQSR